MATIEDKADEQETPDAVEVAQGPVNEAIPLRDVWEHSVLQEAESPYSEQIDLWQGDGLATLRSVDYGDVKAIRLNNAAMEAMVDAWLARHPRELSFEQVTAYMNALPFSVIASMTLDYTGIPDANASASAATVSYLDAPPVLDLAD